MRDVLIGTAGHIDHGKTTLLKALTGIDADRLAEEKRRGITIDLGFAHLETGDFRLGFIDVPGHERFVKNMLAGIGGIRLVLLVVAADESVMPQTREHFQICKLLGIRRGVIVLTKADLVEEELLELVEAEVRDLVEESFLETAPVVAVDSLSGRGMDDFRSLLLEQVEKAGGTDHDEESRRPFRLPIDRVFSLHGFGTVVTGTAMSGKLGVDTPVRLYPGNLTAKVRSIQVFERKEPQAWAGQRTALNLTGVDKADLVRGMVASPPGAWEPSSMLDVDLQLLPDAPAPLKHRGPIRFHHGSSEILGRAFLLEGTSIDPGESGLAQLRLQAPTVCRPGDRFIIRRYSPMRTIGGGLILDNLPPKHTRKTLRTTLPALQSLAKTVGEASNEHLERALLRYFIDSAGEAGIPLGRLAARIGLKAEDLAETLRRDSETELPAGEPRLAVGRSILKGLQERIEDQVRDYHRDNPLAPGIAQQELKSRCLPRAPDSLFHALLDRMAGAGVIKVTAGTVRSPDHRVKLSPEQARLKDEILACFKDEQLQSPSLADLSRELPGSEAEIRELFFHLLQREDLVRITQELVLSQRQLKWLLTRLRERFERGAAFDIAQFKETFGVTRKYAIPLLEYLDRQRITRRAADKRILL